MVQSTRIIRFPNTMRVPAGHPKLLVADIADDFNRGNNASLGSTPLGAKVWTNVTGAQIINQVLDMSAVTGSVRPRFSTGFANFDVEARLAAIGSTAATMSGGLVVRYASESDYYWLSTRISGGQVGVQFWQSLAGAVKAVGSSSPVLLRGGDTIKVTADGGNLTAFINGVQVAAVTGVHTSTAQVVGFFANGASVQTKWASIQVKQR